MTAQELRISNYVVLDKLAEITMISNDGDCYISYPDEKDVDDTYTFIKNIEPIPLTPAVLEACGFEFRYDGSHVMLLVIGDHKKETEQSFQFWVNTDHISISRCGINAYSAPCDSLHKLQNLYYSLTGQELQIDIEKLKNALK